jgi:hypothetical protein
MPTFPVGGDNARVNVGGAPPSDHRLPLGTALLTVRLRGSVVEM